MIAKGISTKMLHAVTALYLGSKDTPFSPPSGLATGSFNGLHPKRKFLIVI